MFRRFRKYSETSRHVVFTLAVITNEMAEAQGVGTSVGIGAAVIIFILIILGLVYLRL